MATNKLLPLLFIVFSFISCNNDKSKPVLYKENKTPTFHFPKWQEGYLDIHHINTGNGDTSFFIFPDGTTMLFDAGLIHKEAFEKKYRPLKATTTKPTDSLSAAQWTANYIKQIILKDSIAIDYALVSHFHDDHYGSLVELGNIIPIKKIIDRNYPDYDFPFDLKKHLSHDNVFKAYLSFIEENHIPAQKLQVGNDKQITLLNYSGKYPTFTIRNIKSNATIWTGKDNDTIEYFAAKDMIDHYKGKYNENPLSLALKISYGDFDYFTGGDNTGLQGFGLPYWFDVETPIAKAVGKVETITLNHHGNRDATNEFFINTLDPKVIIQQSWCSDHPGQEVYQRLIYKDKDADGRDLYATNLHDETKTTYGPWFVDNYKSMQGHIVIRVHPEGKLYEVIILNDSSSTLEVKETFGPYYTK